jgi:peptide/nickel transport system permease protein
MLAFAARRVVGLIVTLLAAALVVFFVLEILPGDPASVMLGVQATPETLAAVRAEYGLDRPVPVRFVQWIAGLATGDLGVSYTYRVPVATLILERLAVTVPLALIAIALSTAIAIPLGVFAAARHARPADAGVMVFSQLGVAVPNFWFGLLLVLLFSVTLNWAPSGGFPGWASGPAALGALVLPAISLALPQAAILARVMRTALVDVQGSDYIRTARAKGLTLSEAVWKHGVRNAMLPVLTILGLQFAYLVAGTVIVENVFYLPGLGRLIFDAISARDLILVRSSVIILVLAVIGTMFLTEMAYAWVDPRLRSRRAE